MASKWKVNRSQVTLLDCRSETNLPPGVFISRFITVIIRLLTAVMLLLQSQVELLQDKQNVITLIASRDFQFHIFTCKTSSTDKGKFFNPQLGEMPMIYVSKRTGIHTHRVRSLHPSFVWFITILETNCTQREMNDRYCSRRPLTKKNTSAPSIINTSTQEEKCEGYEGGNTKCNEKSHHGKRHKILMLARKPWNVRWRIHLWFGRPWDLLCEA